MTNFFNDRTSKITALFSLIMVITGIVSALIYLLVIQSPVLDTISVLGLTLWMSPFIFDQIAFTAGTRGFFIDHDEIPKWVARMMYLFIFPFVNMFVFSGIISLFHLFPLREKINGIWVRADHSQEMWASLAVMYGVLITIGLIWRYFRSKKLSIA